MSSNFLIVFEQLTVKLLFEGFGYIVKSKFFKSSINRIGQLPSDSQLPNQCCTIVSDVIEGKTLSLKFDETPQG